MPDVTDASPAPEPDGLRRTTAVASDGTRLAVQVSGPPPSASPRTPVLLLAGQANSHRWWDGLREDLDVDRTTVTLDWRGTGASDAPDAPYGTPVLAGDAVAVLDALGLGRVDVHGTSMGGRVAQWLAADHPERVRRLVLGCTSPGGPHAAERGPQVRRALADPDPERARAALVDLMVPPSWVAQHGEPTTVLGDPGMTPASRGRHLVCSNRHDAWDALPRIVAPTLVLHGDEDAMAPVANAALLVERVPDARVHVLAGARHAYFLHRRAEAAALVRDFLD
ncbi:alpha/beta fold hydrolase [Lapillicoccus jejuensis]|uniref:alpha/beta fold hydrolase n=1 Tax=Lapillicoccus jejuensis TaxID=402171 RepID=UPI001B883EBE|nr:alpha/beta fold hydrolase [Lapillicoccus jejuensis]